MFRLLHVGSKLGFNMLKGASGLDHQSPSDIMSSVGGTVYQKAAQATSVTDPDAAVFRECVAWDAPKLQSRFQKYCEDVNIVHKDCTFIASGSVGGVFRLPPNIKDGHCVVKVQYAGIREQFHADIEAIQKAGSVFLSKGRQDAIQQLKDLFIKEFDYAFEARNIEKVREIWSGPLECSAYGLKIPEVYLDFCKLDEGVLAIEFMEGTPLNTYLTTCKDKAQRVDLARRILSFILGTWCHGLVFADPHWGNFIVHDDSDTLGVVDFGTIHHVDHAHELSMHEVLRLIHNASSMDDFVRAVQSCRLAHLYSDTTTHTIFPAYQLFHRVLLSDKAYHFDKDTLEEIHSLLKRIDNVKLKGVVPVTRCLLIAISMFCYMDIDMHVKDMVQEGSALIRRRYTPLG